MDSKIRRQILQEIAANKDSIWMTGIRLRYQGEMKEWTANKIPLEYLTYNPYNGRIGSRVKTHEKEHGKLNPEDPEHIEIIEDYLWKSNITRNENTLKDLIDNHQEKPGIVTHDGIIVDGNRRASLLNRIAKHPESYPNKNIDHTRYFKAIILPSDADVKEIMRLETTYQMGRDEIVDYGAIEKYLKCKDLKEAGFSEIEIADFMSEKESEISTILGVMNLMDEYLQYCGIDSIYTRLDKKEDPLIRLFKDIKVYSNHSGVPDWGYDPEIDVSDLKAICFDYIRSDFDRKDFRTIGLRSHNNGLFATGEVWDQFSKQHFDQTEPIASEEKSLDDWRKDYPGISLDKVAEKRDKHWQDQTDGALKNNFYLSQNKLTDISNADQPLQLLEKAIQAVEAVNTDARSFFTEDVKDLCTRISQTCFEYKKMIDRNR